MRPTRRNGTRLSPTRRAPTSTGGDPAAQKTRGRAQPLRRGLSRRRHPLLHCAAPSQILKRHGGAAAAATVRLSTTGLAVKVIGWAVCERSACAAGCAAGAPLPQAFVIKCWIASRITAEMTASNMRSYFLCNPAPRERNGTAMGLASCLACKVNKAPGSCTCSSHVHYTTQSV